MSGELPVGWSACTLGDIVERIETGKSVKCDERPPQGEENGLVKISAVTWGKFNEQESKTLFDSSHLKPEEKIQLGDFLISRANTLELVGSCVMVKQLSKSLYLSDKVLRLVLAEETKPWLLACLRTQNGRKQIESLATGNQLSMRNISQQALKEIRIPLPPLAEQTRIAQKLDELLAQVDTLKARIDAIPALLKRFRQSVVAAAVSGRLTEEWRKENVKTAQWTEETIKACVQSERSALGFKPVKVNKTKVTPRVEAPKNWVWLKLSEVSLKITDGAHNTPRVMEQGFPYITAKDLTGGYLDFTEKKFISENDHRELYKKCCPSRGDLLIVNIGAGTGNNSLVNIDFEFSFKNIAIIKRSNLINPQYLKVFFDSRKETIFNEQTQGGAQPFLSLTMLGNIEIVLPPPEEQTDIIRRVAQLFAFADQFEAKVASAKSRINHLTQSILAKAFRGELVPQDPNDEPARVLLERIKAQRAAAPKAKRGRKTTAV